jgi:outer membrane murein-binding lipoprotein Lpp
MKRLLVAATVAVVLLVATATADVDHSADYDKLDDRIDQLTSRVNALIGKIDARVDPARIRRAHSLEQRVVRLEGECCLIGSQGGALRRARAAHSPGNSSLVSGGTMSHRTERDSCSRRHPLVARDRPHTVVRIAPGGLGQLGRPSTFMS